MAHMHWQDVRMHEQGVHTDKARECDMPTRHHEVVYLLRTYVKDGLCPGGFNYMVSKGAKVYFLF